MGCVFFTSKPDFHFVELIKKNPTISTEVKYQIVKQLVRGIGMINIF
jgi:hypothetical protein